MDKDYQQSIKRQRDQCREVDEISDADSEAVPGYNDRIKLLGPLSIDRRNDFQLMRLVSIAQSICGLAKPLDDVHMDAINLCLRSRDELRSVTENILVPEDGEQVTLYRDLI